MPTPEAIEARMLAMFASEAARQRLLLPRITAMQAHVAEQRNQVLSWRAATAESLQAILEHATTTVPRYRGLASRKLADFPTIAKEDVRDSFVDHVSDDIARIPARRVHTSGTSGVPGVFLHDDAIDVVNFAVARVQKEHHLEGAPTRVLRPFQTWPLAFRVIDAPAIGDGGIGVFGASRDASILNPALHAAQQFRPTVLHGHPSQLLDLAVASETAAVTFGDCRVAYTYGERLDPRTRAHLEGVFGCPTVDGYGLREFGEIAEERKPGVFQVSREKAIVEVLDEDGAPTPHGDEGEIVITGLHNSALPLIRYRTGDRGRLTGDQDGAFQHLELTVGRMLATLDIAGTVIELTKLVHALRGQHLRRYQIVRLADDALEFRVTPGAGCLPREAIEAELAVKLGPTTEFTVREVAGDDYVLSQERKLSDYVDLRP